MGVATGALIVVGIGAAITAVSSTVNAVESNNLRKEEEEKAEEAAELMEELEANRQKVRNPYENLTNEYANLGVATEAAKFQAEESDIALANTLDTLRATGTGAGGATALAQAALQSKRGVAVSLHQQEAQNQKLAAQGQMQVDQMKASGDQWAWQQQENRELQKLNRTQAQQDRAEMMSYQYRADTYAAIGEVGGAFMDFGGAAAGMGGGGGGAKSGGGAQMPMSSPSPNYSNIGYNQTPSASYAGNMGGGSGVGSIWAGPDSDLSHLTGQSQGGY